MGWQLRNDAPTPTALPLPASAGPAGVQTRRYGRAGPIWGREPITPRRIIGGIGKVLVGIGAVIILFTVYLLWGTGLFESSHQNSLRKQFDRECSAIHCNTSATTEPVPGPTTTTEPISGVQPAIPGAVPAEGQPVGILQIPKIGLDKVIVEGTGTTDLRLGPGHYPGTPLPGQPGNAAIAGHRTTYGAPFYNLNELATGDSIWVTTTQGKFLYKVAELLVVSPSNVSVVASTTSPELTLTTCNPRFSAAQRLVVHATLTGAPAPAPPPGPTGTGVPAARPAGSQASGLAGEQGSWVGPLAWGLAFLALLIGIWLVARWSGVRWATYSLGALALLALLFFFFQSVSPLLPASF